MSIELKNICKANNNTDLLKASASILEKNSESGLLKSYHNTCEEIIYDDIIPSGIIGGERYLYSLKTKLVEDNGIFETNISNYNFKKSFLLKDRIYFLSDVFGIWYTDIIDNKDNNIILSEIKQSTVTAGSFYDFVFIDENTVKVFGDSVYKITYTVSDIEVIYDISLENKSDEFSFITTVLLLPNNNILCGTYDNGLFIYTNDTNEFVQTNIKVGRINNIEIYNNKIYIGTEYDGIYVSNVDNINFEKTNIINITIRALSNTNAGLFAAVNKNGIYKLDENTNEFIPTNLIYKKFNFIQQTTQGIFCGGYATGIYKWDVVLEKFELFKEYSNIQYTSCIEKITQDVSSIYFIGNSITIFENDSAVIDTSSSVLYTGCSLVSNTKLSLIFLFSDNGGIQFYDRSYYLKDKIEIRIFNILPNTQKIVYKVEEFNEGDRVVILNTPDNKKSIEYGLKNYYLVVTEGGSGGSNIDDNNISLYNTWSSEKITDELNKTKQEITTELKPFIENTVNKSISTTKINGGKIDASGWL